MQNCACGALLVPKPGAEDEMVCGRVVLEVLGQLDQRLRDHERRYIHHNIFDEQRETD